MPKLGIVFHCVNLGFTMVPELVEGISSEHFPFIFPF